MRKSRANIVVFAVSQVSQSISICLRPNCCGEIIFYGNRVGAISLTSNV